MSKNLSNRRTVCFLLAAIVRAGDAVPVAPPSVETILSDMAAADRARRAQLSGYTSVRQYSVENQRFKTTARMRAELTVDPGGAKHFRVLEMSGPLPVRKLVFQGMLDTEAQASTRDGQEATRISPANYVFRLVSLSEWQGRKCFILEAEPKTSSPLLLRGRIWVDAGDHAVVRIEGSPARNPSFWVNKTNFVHEYTKVGAFWLPKSNTSETDVRVFGHTTVRIEYTDYKVAAEPRPGPSE